MSAQAPLLSIASSGTRARWLRRARIVAWPVKAVFEDEAALGRLLRL